MVGFILGLILFGCFTVYVFRVGVFQLSVYSFFENDCCNSFVYRQEKREE